MFSCSDYTPKPLGYNRIERTGADKKEYSFPHFSFEYPADIKVDTLKPDKRGELWFNLVYPEYKAVIYCTYIPITRSSFSGLIEDSYRIAYSHSVKADDIWQEKFAVPSRKVYGIVYHIEGDVASPVQFFVTDSIRHFMRGSFYYSVAVNPDSAAPVTGYINEDIKHLLSTFRWGKRE
jgi:gliding motility-associated lipoprotein GldD